MLKVEYDPYIKLYIAAATSGGYVYAKAYSDKSEKQAALNLNQKLRRRGLPTVEIGGCEHETL